MGWLITLGILVVLAVLPLGVSVRYDASGALVQVILGPIRIKVFPLSKKEKKPEKKKEEPVQPQEEQSAEEPKPEPPKEDKPKEEPKKAGGSITQFLPLVQLALDFLGDFRRKLRVNVLELKLIMAGDDPADLGINYGRAWIALGNLWPRLERLFVIKKRDVEVECDFEASETLVTARLDISITLGRIIALVVRYGIRAVKEFLKIRKQNKGGATI